MLYNVLLVDDEEMILEGLTQVIHWEALGFGIAGTASHGREALALLQTRPIDLVLTDIRMPFIDGIELIRKVSGQYPGVKTVIVSGYGDFEYARQAIQYGAAGYLLKPTQQDELHELLAKIKDQLDEERALRANAVEARKYAENQAKYSLESAVRELIQYNGKEAAAQVGRMAPQRHYGICLIKDFRDGNMPVFSKVINELNFKQLLPSDWIHVLLKNDGFVVLFFACDSAHNPLQPLLKGILAAIRESGKPLLYEPLLFATEAYPFGGLQQVHQVYKQSLERLEYTFYATDGIIRVLPEEASSVPEAETARSAAGMGDGEIREFVNNLLLSDRPEAARHLTDELIAGLKAGFYSASAIRQTVSGVLEQLRKAFAEYVAQGSEINLFDLGRLPGIYTFERLDVFLKDSILRFTQMLQEHHINYFTRLIYLVYKYVDEHYRDNIKLDDVAKTVNLSTTYFCYVFKKETGLTFIDYLIRYRLEKSKQLLAETNLKLYEIAERVGYRDVRHYTKQFKRMYRMRPGEFRRE